MKQTYRKHVVYVIPTLRYGTPVSVRTNIAQRTRLMKHLGYRVTQLQYRRAWSLPGWRNLYRLTAKAGILMIRVDGSCIGELYTLIKILRPNLRVFWEIHGFPEENAPDDRVLFLHVIQKYRRMMLSFLVYTAIYISEELKQYAANRIFADSHMVIPNFISTRISHFSLHHQRLSTELQKKITGKFIVLWGGSPQFPWQGIDLIKKLSTYIEQIDLQVMFIVIGKNSWYPLKNSRNVLQITNLRRSAYLALLNKADVCLALYNKPPQIPLYFFPMKILDYMYRKKPVIATAFPVASSIIMHGSDGFLVPNDIGEITFSIMKLKNNPILRQTIGNAAHATVSGRFSDHQAKQAYKNILT